MGACPPLFAGLPAEEQASLLARLERRRFPAGAPVLVQGEQPHVVYVIHSGTVEISIADAQGNQHTLSRIGPGETIGEMSLLTGSPISATVRVTDDGPLEVFVLSEDAVQQIAARFPRVYRNLATILSERLVRTNWRTLHRQNHTFLLVDRQAPPVLGYALACSLAWHTRVPTLLLVVGCSFSDELTALALHSEPPPLAEHFGRRSGFANTRTSTHARAHLMLVPPGGAFSPESLAGTLEELGNQYGYVLVQISERVSHLVPAIRSLYLAGLHGPPVNVRAGSSGYILRAWADGTRRKGPDQAGDLPVPALNAADEQSLKQGILPAYSPAGRALGWAARDLGELKIGVALGAGAAKGYAHIGVLRFLEQLGLPIDYLAGTSIGGIVAALYALGYGSEAMSAILDHFGATAFRLALPITSLLSSVGIRRGMRQIAGQARIEALDVPLALIAADLVTGQEVVFRQGLLWAAAIASMSIPGMYAPQRFGGYTLVDGGLINPVPGDVVAEMGADRVIAIKLSSWPASPRVWTEAQTTFSGGPPVLQTALRSIELMKSQLSARTAATATVLIEPLLKDGNRRGLRHFRQGRQFIPTGEAAAEAALPRLVAAFPWLRG